MKQPKIIVAGIGPGNEADITPAVISALQESDAVVGYKYYFRFVIPHLCPETACIDTGMKRERTRAEQAFELAEQGKTVCVISSGDAGICGMTPLIYEMKRERNSAVEIVSLPGISAFQKAASLLGAPVGHDFCVISLSDLMTPWERIEKRIIAAADADFVTAVYNPKSEGRYWQLYRLKELFLQEGRSPETPVGYVRQAGRPEQAVRLTTLGEFNPEEVDMFTVVLIGNSQSYEWNGTFITPRGYYSEEIPAGKPQLQSSEHQLQSSEHQQQSSEHQSQSSGHQLRSSEPQLQSPEHQIQSSGHQLQSPEHQLQSSQPQPQSPGLQLQNPEPQLQLNKGQDIMIRSFRTIEKELKHPDIPLDHKWALLHAIHTTADFEMEHLLHTDKGAVASLYQAIKEGRIRTIVTDVTMAASGIRKGALQRLGVEVKCYLGDPRTATMAAEKGITRTQAGIRLAVEEHPDAFFVFGNAPTALMELCDLIRKGKAHPAGIIAAPVGFVHVQESKHMVKPFTEIPKIIVEGRKGGSNLAATLVNAVLCYNDAEQLRPGRDV